LARNIKKIKKMAAKKTVKQAKQELFNLKKEGKKLNREKFEEYVKNLYKKNLENMLNN